MENRPLINFIFKPRFSLFTALTFTFCAAFVVTRHITLAIIIAVVGGLVSGTGELLYMLKKKEEGNADTIS